MCLRSRTGKYMKINSISRFLDKFILRYTFMADKPYYGLSAIFHTISRLAEV